MIEYKVLIRESHLDTFGHVNNSTYFMLFEEARWELLTQNAYDLKYIQKSGLGPVVLETHVKFLKELRLRETIKITVELVRQQGKIAEVKQVMLKENGEVACEAFFVFGLFDTKARKLVDPTPEWLKAIGAS